MENQEPRKIQIWSNEEAIPFENVLNKFRKRDVFICNAQSNRFRNNDDFQRFALDMEDVMRKHGVFVVNASIFADL